MPTFVLSDFIVYMYIDLFVTLLFFVSYAHLFIFSRGQHININIQIMGRCLLD